jgi:hypothetical protein
MIRAEGFPGDLPVAGAENAWARVHAATTANITLSGEQTVDGVALVAGNRCLVKDHATGATKGIYIVSAGAWTRSPDCNNTANIRTGKTVYVAAGTTNGQKTFTLTTTGTITVDTTSLIFAELPSLLTYFTAGQSTTAPNATIYVSYLAAAGSATNIDAALVPKGTGALTAQVADSTIAGGNKRSIGAVDWQRYRVNADEVASGDYSTLGGGRYNKASGEDSTVGGGNNNIASGQGATVGGGGGNTSSGHFSYSVGYANEAVGNYSVALGYIITVGANSFGFSGGTDFQRTNVSAFSQAFFLSDVTLMLGNTDNAARGIRFLEPNTDETYASVHYTEIKAQAQAANVTYTLPAAAPAANGYVLVCTTGGVMSWSAMSAGITWSNVTGTSQSAAVNTGYIANNAALVTVTLPASAAVGDVIKIQGAGAGGWLLAQNASQTVIGNASTATTAGVGGSVASTDRYDSIEIVCITANTTFAVTNYKGTLTFT